MEPIQKHKHTIGGMEVLYMEQAELQKTKGNKTSFAGMGPLSVLHFKSTDRFVLRLNDWMYPLMMKLPITRTDKGKSQEIMYEMPALNGFTYKLKIMGNPNPNLIANLEMILSHHSGFMDKDRQMQPEKMELSPERKRMAGEESPEEKMSERMIRSMQIAKETVEMMRERAMKKAGDIMSRRKMLDLKMMKKMNFRKDAKSRIKSFCAQTEKATQEFMNMRMANPNLTQARTYEELRKMDSKMPMLFIRREELDIAMMNNREIVSPGSRKAAQMERKKMPTMPTQTTPQKAESKHSVLGWFKQSLSGIKEAFNDMMGRSSAPQSLTDQDLMGSPEKTKPLMSEQPTGQISEGEVHDTNYMMMEGNPVPVDTLTRGPLGHDIPREQRNQQRMRQQGQERRNAPRQGMKEQQMPTMMAEGMEHYQG